jgi:hypothetical protein
MRYSTLVLIVICLFSTGFGEAPEFYGKVDRMTWVVEDLESTAAGWAKVGFTDVVRHGEVNLQGLEFRGKPAAARVKAATVLFGDVAVDWVQPLGGDNAFTEFLAAHGSGVISLVHRAPDLESFKKEVERMKGLGVDVLQKVTLPSANGDIHYVFFDTEKKGKYSVGMLYVPGGDYGPLAVPDSEPKKKINQYAFVVKDLKAVNDYWVGLGFPAAQFSHPYLWDLKYGAEDGEFDAELGFQRDGKVTYEWIMPLKGPTCYVDHMEKHGEGFHHVAFETIDFFEAVEEWNHLGFPFLQGGAWGEKDKPGHGRFAYHDTDAAGGISVELLWNYK